MESISTLVQDDPYLKMPRRERIASRKVRRAKLGRLEAAIDTATVALADKKPQPEPVFSFGAWVARQEQLNPLPKAPWFSIESDLGPPEPARPKIEEIQRVVAKYYRVSRTDMVSARRAADIVRPRQVAYFLSKALTLKSLPEIGRRFGGRDHTTALSGIRKIERLRKTDASLQADLNAIASSLGGSL